MSEPEPPELAVEVEAAALDVDEDVAVVDFAEVVVLRIVEVAKVVVESVVVEVLVDTGAADVDVLVETGATDAAEELKMVVDLEVVVLCPGRPGWVCSAFLILIVSEDEDDDNVLVDVVVELSTHMPNADWHPAAQYAGLVPQYP